MRKVKMGALMAMLGGSTLFGGCLGGNFLNPQRIFRDLTSAVITEFLLDNNAIFDLFPDDLAPA